MSKDKESKEKEKEHQHLHKIVKAGEKYHCGECGAEVVFGKDCPACKVSLDWQRIRGQVRYL